MYSHPNPGLSPLTRGNRRANELARQPLGPIPAHAGEPLLHRTGYRVGGAYPRSRGGTHKAGIAELRDWGLSPLTRGNPAQPGALPTTFGPIPAHAGEPRMCSRRDSPSGAYPRSRGGTLGRRLRRLLAQGLSPLTRGNRRVVVEIQPVLGPIPAHAGEPTVSGKSASWSRAYPRSRGGTHGDRADFLTQQGLSPLTRGNLFKCCFVHGVRGPIPAHAGEPLSGPSPSVTLWAYPRSRGGTVFKGKKP